VGAPRAAAPGEPGGRAGRSTRWQPARAHGGHTSSEESGQELGLVWRAGRKKAAGFGAGTAAGWEEGGRDLGLATARWPGRRLVAGLGLPCA
jgi:hypothetical protein